MKTEKKEFKENLKKWLALEIPYLYKRSKVDFLRVNGSRIDTTQGVQIPLEIAKRLYQSIASYIFATNSNTSSSSAVTESASPTPTKAATAGVSGSFTGDAYNVSYGMVQVRITVSNGKITDAVALQSPMGRSQRFSDYAIPNLRSQTLAAQSAAIHGVSGASYTSYGWYKSLISALQKAGMNTGV